MSISLLTPSNNTSTSSSSQGAALPWQSANPDTYFPFINIKGENWDQLFPYRFLVVDAANNNRIVTGVENQNSSTVTVDVRSILDASEINVNFGNSWEARLPITPQALDLTTLPAVVNTPGLRGILEEHSGVRYKNITLSCSTGIYPARSAFGAELKAQSSISSIFAGTLSAVNSLNKTIKATINTIKGGNYQSSPDASDIDLKQTGYYHALYIDQFIEQYLIAKKRPEGKSWRLVLDIPKQNASYYVTPGPFSLKQNANKPMEWNWSIQLKAWKRVDLNSSQKTPPKTSLKLTLSSYQNAINGINNARQAIQASLNVVKAVRSDVLGVVNDLRQISLLIKDTANFAQTAADLPRQLTQDLKSAMADIVVGSDFEARSVWSAYDKKRIDALKKQKLQNENLSLSQVQNKAQGREAKAFSSSSPAYNMFDNPETAFSILNEIPLDSLPFNIAQSEAFQKEITQVRNFTVQDIKNKRASFYSLYLDLSNKLGTNSDLVNSIYNRPSPSSRPYPLSLDESQLLYAIFDAIQAFDAISATRELDTSRVLSPMKFVQDLAQDSGIDFGSESGKVLVPVPYGLSIEEIALRYLNDPNRWIEIVTLNSLREPYIDEEGFERKLLSNADGRAFTITSAENLFVGQKIVLSSSVVSPFTRRITNIEKITNFSYLITVDGVANLEDLKSADLAKIKAYLPGTINSQDMIFIPTNEPFIDVLSPTITSGVSQDTLALTTKVDFLLTENMDVALDANGDFRFASGMTNLIQALKIKFLTKRGDLLAHPNFGLSVNPGISVADFESNQIFKEINQMILSDERFSKLERLTINLDGPKMIITLFVIPKGDNGVVPISFSISR